MAMRKVTRPPKPEADRLPASEPAVPLRPLAKRIGEGRNNLKARAIAFSKRRRRTT
jgi:hypothetical protein